MDQPEIAQKSPHRLEFALESRYWCACGRFRNQPFRDVSHKGSRFTPVKLEMANHPGGAVWLQTLQEQTLLRR